jgi:hypothetical protein
MTTKLRSALAFLLSVAVLAIFAISAGAGIPGTEGASPDDPGGGSSAMCVEDHPDCGDVVGGGGGIVADPGCGEQVSGEGPDATVSYTACGDAPDPVPTPTVVAPTPGMADVYRRPFDDATVGADGVTVTIDFVSGIEPCYVLDHVDVVEGPDTVTITLYEGHDPAAGDVACIDIGVFKATVVTLAAPLGDRTIVDGAALER